MRLLCLRVVTTPLLTTRISAEPSPVEGFPMRSWSIEIWLLDDQGNEVLPTVFEKCTYNLHPSFEKNKQGARAEYQTLFWRGS
jgi:transcription initiation factor IIF auxiliary subunit